MNYGKPTRVLWIDLDGTVRYSLNGTFVNKADDVAIFDGVRERLHSYKAHGWRIVAVSNQGGIALGHLTLEQCADAMMKTQHLCGDVFDKISWCQHHPDAKDPEYARCWCRKPKIGLIIETGLSLSAKHGEYYPPHLGLFVGDRDEDRECAANANLDFMSAEDWRSGKHAERVTNAWSKVRA